MLEGGARRIFALPQISCNAARPLPIHILNPLSIRPHAMKTEEFLQRRAAFAHSHTESALDSATPDENTPQSIPRRGLVRGGAAQFALTPNNPLMKREKQGTWQRMEELTWLSCGILV
jgi:hypothetical protein